MSLEIGNQQGDTLNILLNAKLGDGGIYISGRSVNAHMQFMSKSADLLVFKRDLCAKYLPGNLRILKSGYKEGSISHAFSTRVHTDITNMYNLSNIQAIDLLSKDDLILWYLDDGSYHQKKHFMNLYCNMFNECEAVYLADKIYSLYTIKRPSLCWDKKRDGRKYPYLYLPLTTVAVFIKDVADFIVKNELWSLAYKAGKSIPSTTIETTI